MNKSILTLVIFVTTALTAYLNAQNDTTNADFISSGKMHIKIFSNFHTSLDDNYDESAFEIKRAYFGYRHQLSEEFSASVKLDIGSPDDVSQYSLLRRFAYFKTAALTYEKNKLIWNFGLIDLLQFKSQEKFWGHRYIYKSYMDQYKYGKSADIGTNIIYQVNKYLCADITVMNGEGYSDLQADNTYRAGAGLTFTPNDNIIARLYYDYTEKSEAQATLSGFVGYTYKEKVKAAGEYNYQTNNKFILNQDMMGYSFYASYDFKEKWQLFSRYDNTQSYRLEGEDNPWNYTRDGQAFIGGVQYSPIGSVKIAANYQSWIPEADDIGEEHYFFINFEYQFK